MHIQGDDPVQGKDSDMSRIMTDQPNNNINRLLSHGLEVESISFRNVDIADIQEIRMPPDLTISSLQNMKKRIIIWLQC